MRWVTKTLHLLLVQPFFEILDPIVPHESKGLPTTHRCLELAKPSRTVFLLCIARTCQEALRRAMPCCHDGSRHSSDIWRSAQHIEMAWRWRPHTQTHTCQSSSMSRDWRFRLCGRSLSGTWQRRALHKPGTRPSPSHRRRLGMKGSDDPGDSFFFSPARPHHLDSTTSCHLRPAWRLGKLERASGRFLEG